MTTAKWYAWITTSNADFAEALCAKLIKRGFAIASTSAKLVLEWDDSPARVISISLCRVPRNNDEAREYTASGVYAEVEDVIKQVKGKYWSMVVAMATDCVWNVGNERISKQEKEAAEAYKKIN